MNNHSPSMKVLTELPHRFTETEDCWIVLQDGVTLAAKLWLPDIAARQPVPCIIEVLPYRKRDAYSVRDSALHRYLAGHGYAAMRIDMRGSGDSDGHQGVFDFAAEQDDTLQVLAWIARQPWSDGQVSMIGVSWGGLQGIQTSARRPPQLASVIAVAFAQDHYFYGQVFHGGCLPLRAARWSAQVFGYKSRPPDPALVGSRWRDMWLERLAHNQPQLIAALRHPLRDAFWQRQAVAFGDIECPVFVAGGWADIAYVGSVGEALAHVRGPRTGLIGPWGHNYPHLGVPGPAIGFLQEALAWFDRWMRGGPAPARCPALRAWISRGLPARAFYPQAEGRWVAEAEWPSARIQPRRYHLNPQGAIGESAGPRQWIASRSPQTTGLQGGELMPWFQHGPAPELPGDQREDDGKSLCFDSEPLAEDLEILGACLTRLTLMVDQAQAFLCVRLCEVTPEGASTRVAMGILNLTHRNGHDQVEPLVPGEAFEVCLRLVDCGYAFARGNRLRLALSTTYWPLIWPSPSPVTLQLATGSSSIELPVRPPDPLDAQLPPFDAPEAADARQRIMLSPAGRTRKTVHDAGTGMVSIEITDTAGRSRLDDIDLETEAVSVEHYSLREDDPLSATAQIDWVWHYRRQNWQVRTEASQRTSCTEDTFIVDWTLRAYEGEELTHETTRRELIPRLGI